MMSDRGSFVTGFIYCEKCAESARKFFVEEDHGGYVQGDIIKGGRIFAGFFAHQFVVEFSLPLEGLRESICHPLTIAFLPEEEGQRQIITIQPRETKRSDSVYKHFSHELASLLDSVGLKEVGDIRTFSDEELMKLLGFKDEIEAVRQKLK